MRKPNYQRKFERNMELKLIKFKRKTKIIIKHIRPIKKISRNN